LPRAASFTGSYDGFVSVYFLMFGAFASLVLMMARRLCTAGWLIIGVGATGVLVEWIAARLDFPYTIALTVWRNPAFLWLAGWTGVWGLSFLIWTPSICDPQQTIRKQCSPAPCTSMFLSEGETVRKIASAVGFQVILQGHRNRAPT
jgi:apolipoprotein N-acyltransferase